MHSSPALSSTRLLKVVVYFWENHLVPFSSNCSVVKVRHYMYNKTPTRAYPGNAQTVNTN